MDELYLFNVVKNVRDSPPDYYYMGGFSLIILNPTFLLHLGYVDKQLTLMDFSFESLKF